MPQPEAASREEKETFQEIGNIISSVPIKEKYVILGDFNDWVGSRENVVEQ